MNKQSTEDFRTATLFCMILQLWILLLHMHNTNRGSLGSGARLAKNRSAVSPPSYWSEQGQSPGYGEKIYFNAHLICLEEKEFRQKGINRILI